MSDFTAALQVLFDRQLAATSDDERQQIEAERTELLRRHYCGKGIKAPAVTFDHKVAQAGDRDA